MCWKHFACTLGHLSGEIFFRYVKDISSNTIEYFFRRYFFPMRNVRIFLQYTCIFFRHSFSEIIIPGDIFPTDIITYFLSANTLRISILNSTCADNLTKPVQQLWLSSYKEYWRNQRKTKFMFGLRHPVAWQPSSIEHTVEMPGNRESHFAHLQSCSARIKWSTLSVCVNRRLLEKIWQITRSWYSDQLC